MDAMKVTRYIKCFSLQLSQDVCIAVLLSYSAILKFILQLDHEKPKKNDNNFFALILKIPKLSLDMKSDLWNFLHWGHQAAFKEFQNHKSCRIFNDTLGILNNILNRLSGFGLLRGQNIVWNLKLPSEMQIVGPKSWSNCTVWKFT